MQTPASAKALSTPARAKASNAKLASVLDSTLTSQISEASDRIASLIGICAADNGDPTIGYEEVTEEFRIRCASSFLLNRFPIVSITSFTIDGVAVPVGEFTAAGRFGRIELHETDLYPRYETGLVAIRYFAGWFLPSMSGYPTLPSAPPAPPKFLPDAIELAVFDCLCALKDDQSRDMGLREEQSDEVDRFVYFGGGAATQTWRTVEKRIAPYIRTII